MKRIESIVFWGAAAATTLAFLGYTASRARGALGDDRPIALGAVHYRSSVDTALSEAKTSGKPVFLQFQEVPGCATCQSFGREVLSNPLLVDAIEEHFVPAIVYNNRAADESLLHRFSEPGWNNPVVRFLDGEGKDLVARKDGLYRPHEIAARMIEALEAQKRDVPLYLALARDEADPGPRATIVFAMSCFWEGEGRLGGQNGVLATRVGSVKGRETVEVTFLAQRLDVGSLVKNALAMDCAGAIYCEEAETCAKIIAASPIAKDRLESGAFRFEESPASDQKHALRSSRFASLDLTPSQACRVNSAVFLKGDPTRWLSARQVAAIAK